MESSYVGGNSTYIPEGIEKKKKKKKPLSFSTEDGWCIARNVCIFSSGNVNDQEITHQDLVNIVEKNKELEQETGDAPVIFCGHNKESRDEKAICGFIKNMHINAFGSDQRSALYADMWIFEEDSDVLRKFPRRSVEWSKDTSRISLALLGATEPAFNLSLTFSQNKQEQPRIQLSDLPIIRNIMQEQSISYEKAVDIRKFQLGQQVSTEPKEEKPMIKDKIQELFEMFSQGLNEVFAEIEGDEVREMEEEMESTEDTNEELVEGEEIASEDVEGNDGEDEGGDQTEASPQQDAQDAQDANEEVHDAVHEEEDTLEKNEDAVEDKEDDEDKEKFEQKVDDDHIIGLTPKDPEEDEELEKKTYSSDAERLQFSLDKSNAKLQELQSQIETLTNVANQSDKERQLVDLNRIFKFNLGAEIEIVKNYDKEQFAGHVEIIRGNYQKLPVGISPVGLTTKAPNSTPKTFSAKDRDRVLQLAISEGLDFETAIKQFEEQE